MSVVRIAVSNPIVTHEQLAAQEFEPWPEFVGFDKNPKVNSMNFLEYMSGAREKVEALLSFITAAEIRQACAMANVYSDDGDKLPPIPKPPEEPTLGRRRRRRSTEA